MATTTKRATKCIDPKSGYYLWSDYKNNYFEWRLRGVKGKQSRLHKIMITPIEMIKVYSLVRVDYRTEYMYHLINWTHGDKFTLNQLKTIVEAIKSFKVDYWIKKQKNNKYEDIVNLYRLSDIMENGDE